MITEHFRRANSRPILALTSIACLVTAFRPGLVWASLQAREPAAQSSVSAAAVVCPEPRQIKWQQLEFTIFIHFGLNTFTGREWGTGDEDPTIFNPTELDCRQWALAAQSAGAKGVLIVAKHHDGFCLWPSKYTDFSVKRSPWRGGQGDLIKEMEDACRESGLKLGIYLSPADAHERSYGADSAAYNEYFKNQLRELLTGYGEIYEVFFDGARPLSKNQIYDFAAYYAVIRELQPNAVISTRGPDVRWVGNEQGCARESEWSTIPLPVPPGVCPWPDLTAPDLGSRKQLSAGKYFHWYPAEADLPFGRSWFWHPGQDSNLKSLPALLDVYYNTVGRNAVLLLNLSPDTRGLISATAVERLRQLGTVLRNTFQTNLASEAKITASTSVTGRPGCDTAAILDGKPETFWMPVDWCGPVELTVELPRPTRFNRALFQEHIPIGQRIEAFGLDAWIDGHWKEIARGTTVGYKRLLRFEPVETQKLQIRIPEARVCPTLSSFGLFLEPAL